MNKKHKIIVKILAVICLLPVLLSGCTQMGTSEVPGENTGRLTQNTGTQGIGRNDLAGNTNQQGQENMYGTDNPGAGANMLNGANAGTGATNTGQRSFDTSKAEKIKKQLTKMNGMTEVNVMVLGDTCVVGYKSDSNTGDTAALKNRIVKQVKNADKSITNVAVSESSDIIDRMKRLMNGNNTGQGGNTTGHGGNVNNMNRNTDIMNGDTVIDEFNDMLRTLMPGNR